MKKCSGIKQHSLKILYNGIVAIVYLSSRHNHFWIGQKAIPNSKGVNDKLRKK
jgi:hypothetical protein